MYDPCPGPLNSIGLRKLKIPKNVKEVVITDALKRENKTSYGPWKRETESLDTKIKTVNILGKHTHAGKIKTLDREAKKSTPETNLAVAINFLYMQLHTPTQFNLEFLDKKHFKKNKQFMTYMEGFEFNEGQNNASNIYQHILKSYALYEKNGGNAFSADQLLAQEDILNEAIEALSMDEIRNTLRNASSKFRTAVIDKKDNSAELIGRRGYR